MPNCIGFPVRFLLIAGVFLLLAGCSSFDQNMAESRAIASVAEADRQLNLGRETEARSWLDRAVALNPNAISTYLGSASDSDSGAAGVGVVGCLFSHNDWPDMVLYLTKAVRNPKLNGDFRLWQFLADAQNRLGDSAGAKQSYKRELSALALVDVHKGLSLVAVDPISLSLLRENAEWGAGFNEKARADFKRIISRYPQFAGEAQNDCAYSEAVANVEIPEAYALAQACVRSTRQEPNTSDEEIGEYLDTLAWVEYRMARYKAAERDAEEAVSEVPREPVLHYHLASIYQAIGDGPDARIEIDRAEALCPSDANTQAALRVIDPGQLTAAKLQ